MTHLTGKRWLFANASLAVMLVITLVVSLAVGPERVDWPGAVAGTDAQSIAIVMVSRLPRILLAALVGMALATAGAAYQALLKNPLADPFILGIAGGAALGSVIAMGLGVPLALVPVAAFGGAAVAMLVVFGMSRVRGRLPVHTLLLTGVVFNAFCFALILFVNATVNMEQAYQILFLLIGNLEVIDLATVGIAALCIIPGFVMLCLIGRGMNALTLGDETACTMGHHPERIRRIIFVATSLMVGAAVAVSGLIGFMGLFVPHGVRLVLGADHRLLVPASGLAGAIFLVAADAVARTLLMQGAAATQLPVGVITALVGAPAFLLLLRRQIRSAG